MAKHAILDLTRETTDAENVHRPEIRVWIDGEDGKDTPPMVVVTVSALVGQQMRFFEMTADEANELARLINAKASEARQIEQESEREDEAAPN